MAVAIAWKKVNFTGRYKQVLMKVTYGNGDTSLTIPTGLKIILAYSVSPYTLTTKLLLQATVSGGTITQTVTDPAANAYVFVNAIGL